MKKLIIPHPEKKSRDVTKDDEQMILEDMKHLYALCFKPSGRFPSALALAHVQIEGKDPLRFFVKKDGGVYINPVITFKIQPYIHNEGCMSFPDKPPKDVQRNNVIDIEYILANTKDTKIDMTNKMTTRVSGINAAVVQHELEHFNLNLLY